MTIGEKILNLRTEKKLTQKKLADMCGFSQSALNFWENGKRQPKIEQLQKIASALKVDWKIFIDENYIKKREKEIDTLSNQSEAFKMVGEAFDDPYAENMLIAYSLLNKKGKSEAFNRVSELTEIPRYTKEEE